MASISRPFLSPLLCGAGEGSGRGREGRVYQREVDDDVDDSVDEFRDDRVGWYGIARSSAPWRCEWTRARSLASALSTSFHFL
jgi:hypothetical protein